MKKKSGITVAVLVVAMAIMAIVLSTAVITGASSLKKASLDKFKSQYYRVEEAVALYYDEKGEYPLYKDADSTIEINVESLEPSIKNEIEAKSDYASTFYVLDMPKLLISNVDIGNTLGTTEIISGKKDVFLINNISGNVYYYSGLKTNGKKIHSIE